MGAKIVFSPCCVNVSLKAIYNVVSDLINSFYLMVYLVPGSFQI